MDPSTAGDPPVDLKTQSLWLLAALAIASVPTPAAPADLSASHEEWLDQVEPIIHTDERQAFASLQRAYQRDAFIDRFWHERDPFPESHRNEFAQLWQQRLELAAEQFGSTISDRAHAMLVVGPPAFILADLCPELLQPMEAWYYDETEDRSEAFYLLFVEGADGPDSPLDHGSPQQGIEPLLLSAAPRSALAGRCSRGREMDEVLALATGWEDVIGDQELTPAPTPGWVDDLLDHTTDIDPDSPIITASLLLRYPGRQEDRTVVQAELTIPVEVATLSGPEEGVFNLQIDGELLRRDKLAERFRYQFEVPLSDISDNSIPLAFQRYLYPGEYNLILRLEDLNSGHLFRSEGPIQVPAHVSSPREAPVAQADTVLSTGDHVVKIQPLSDQLLTGRVRVEAQIRGEGIAKVGFVLNGRPVMSKTRPPYSLEIDLGHVPRLHTLEAIAFDVGGQELARDKVPLNGGPHRFGVRLLEPRPGQRYIQSLRAAAEVDLPTGEKLERVEFFLNETRLATLFQPPFVQPILLPQSRRITYVRAVAYLADGNATEDLVIINAPRDMAQLRINMVELYTTVSDKKGHPIEGLQPQDFVVREEGQEQEIRRFELVRDLSIHAGVVIDASTSMQEELQEALDGALEFFEGVIRPKDRASVVVFNDEPILKVPFTSNLEVLANGLVDVESEGETALYDTIVFSLHYFSGLRGKRALILLSDGEDSRSRWTLSETMDFARRSGVAIYTIALGLDRRKAESRSALIRLARETGGRFFSISGVRELEAIYGSIEEELRSQYLLAYQSSHEQGGDFRQVEVEVNRAGLKAKTIPGYYP